MRVILGMMALALCVGQAVASEQIIVTGRALGSGPPEAVTCRWLSAPVGTRIGGNRKVCRTNAIWRQVAADAAEDIRQMQDRDAWHTHMWN